MMKGKFYTHFNAKECLFIRNTYTETNKLQIDTETSASFSLCLFVVTGQQMFGCQHNLF